MLTVYGFRITKEESKLISKARVRSERERERKRKSECERQTIRRQKGECFFLSFSLLFYSLSFFLFFPRRTRENRNTQKRRRSVKKEGGRDICVKCVRSFDAKKGNTCSINCGQGEKKKYVVNLRIEKANMAPGEKLADNCLV